MSTGTLAGDILDAASGGAWSESGFGDAAGDIGGDPLGDILDMGDDILDGDLDDTINDVLDDVTDAAEGAIEDDPSEPQIVYSKNGKLAEVSPVTNVPVIYGTRKIRGISVYKELITETGSNGTITDEDWFLIYTLSEGEIEGLAGIFCNSEFSTSQISAGTSGTFIDIGGSGFDTTWNLHKGIESGETVGYNPWNFYTTLEWPTSGAGVLSKLASIYIRMNVPDVNIGKELSLPKFSFIVKGKKVKVQGYKKAIITLKKGQNIDLTTGI